MKLKFKIYFKISKSFHFFNFNKIFCRSRITLVVNLSGFVLDLLIYMINYLFGKQTKRLGLKRLNLILDHVLLEMTSKKYFFLLNFFLFRRCLGELSFTMRDNFASQVRSKFPLKNVFLKINFFVKSIF